MVDKIRHILLLLLFLTTAVLIADAFGFDEDVDSLGNQPTVNEIRITPQEIDIKYEGNRDTTIYRVGQSSSGGTAYKKDKPVIAFGEDESITEQDTVRADIFIMFGDLLIRGYVRGNITVLFGNVNIGYPGDIEGNITCLGLVSVDSGVHVWGDIKASNLDTPLRSSDYDLRGTFTEMRFSIGQLRVLGPPAMVLMIIILLSVLVIVSLITIIIPKPISRVRYQLENGFIKNFLVGALILIAMFPIWILIIITVIGLPFALLVYPFVVVSAIVLGSIGYTQFAGCFLGRYTTLRYNNLLKTTIAGVILLGAPLIFAAFFAFIGFNFLAWPFQVLFVLSQLVMTCTGLGAVFFSRFGTIPHKVSLIPDFRAASADSEDLPEEI